MKYDLVFIGGGLSSLLATFRIVQQKPSTKILIVESQKNLGGNHIWSFHLSDVPAWLQQLAEKTWSSYDIRFPEFTKTVHLPYGSLQSETLAKIVSKLATVKTNSRVTQFSECDATLSNGDVIKAKCVIDARGLEASNVPSAGYQKFIGQVFEFTTPHPISQPVIIDALASQPDGFRFFYVLPLTSHKLLIENTFYSNNSILNKSVIKDEITSYLNTIVSNPGTCIYEECGALALPLNWNFKSTQNTRLAIGLRGGFFNFVTGYSTPVAAMVADALAQVDTFEPNLVANALSVVRNCNLSQRKYELRLNKLMFLGSDKHNRINIFSRFYKMPSATIERFYAGRLTAFDKVRILFGKPPIPISSAVTALLNRAHL